MSYRKILTMQDISCVGQCSLTVALPILSAFGHETCILPSAVLSTHTAGFHGFTFRDLTEDIPAILAHWKREGIAFDAVYTGYLGSAEQIAFVRSVFSTLLKPGAPKIVDPAMADFGKLYPAFDDAYVAAMRTLVAEADILLPNITEACFLTDLPYRESYDKAYIDDLLLGLKRLGAKNIILTGVGFESGRTGVFVETEHERRYYEHVRIERTCHGTGDVFASVFVGAYLSGKSMFDAARIAADFTVDCIQNTADDPSHWYGVKFEPLLGQITDLANR